MGLKDLLHPYLHRMETEAAGNLPDPHFQEDFETLEKYCMQAVQEAQEITAHIYS
jgi:hypothetical protein